ncbi:hypothetical protein N657DRAFT_649432 [Parathielavia appendiculata]|uniref:Uncharacterized protein n=1 Tax=Parathielavia appendiculata TaxID=2587402 RepID=A0AAN6TSV0_9PEZI|nr:hypothetical protein N657DRAFT_649432 [Parathielavia appendiculata]
MPTAAGPKLQPPMEAANPAQLQAEPSAKVVVTKQPTSEPRPMMEQDDMALRGGGLNHYCGFSCCDGRCNFRLC